MCCFASVKMLAIRTPKNLFLGSVSLKNRCTFFSSALDFKMESCSMKILAVNIYYAFTSVSISNFDIFINALMTRRALSGSDISLANTAGTTCHETPN